MNSRTVALYLGIVFLIVGVAGFVPALSPGGKVLGLFLVDPLHNIVHLLTGVLAIFASKSSDSATVLFFKVFGVVYALVTVLGFLTGTGLFGLLPVNIFDNLFHLVTAAISLYYGFGVKKAPPKA
jgi:hypothetical protein